MVSTEFTTTAQIEQTSATASQRKQRVAAALVALTLGGAILFAAGFAEIPALHNAAHDGRHAFAFPCH